MRTALALVWQAGRAQAALLLAVSAVLGVAPVFTAWMVKVLADRLDGFGSLAEIATAADLVADGDPDDAVNRLVCLVGDSGRTGVNGSIVGAPFVSACAAAAAAELLGTAADSQPAFHAERYAQSAWLSARLAEV